MIDLSEDDPQAVQCMLRFLYTADYDGSDLEPVDGLSDTAKQCRLHIATYAIGAKYGLTSLQKKASEHFWRWSENLLEDSYFADAVRAIYATTSDSFRDLRGQVVELVKERRDYLESNPAFSELLAQEADFVRDLLLNTWNRPTEDFHPYDPEAGCAYCGDALTHIDVQVSQVRQH